MSGFGVWSLEVLEGEKWVKWVFGGRGDDFGGLKKIK